VCATSTRYASAPGTADQVGATVQLAAHSTPAWTVSGPAAAPATHEASTAAPPTVAVARTSIASGRLTFSSSSTQTDFPAGIVITRGSNGPATATATGAAGACPDAERRRKSSVAAFGCAR
jgi:hypothetical protein